MNGATEAEKAEAWARAEARQFSQPSSGYAHASWMQFAAVAPVRKFPMQPQRGEQFFGYAFPPKEQSLSEIRFGADTRARELLALGEQEFGLGNVRHGSDLFEKALALTRNAAIFLKAIRTGMEFDRIDLARKWAALGHQRDPADASLARWDRLLSPPTIRSVDMVATRRSDETAWLQANANQYRGKWVVIAGSQLLGFGNTLTEALNAARSRGPVTGALAHRILE